MAQSTESQRAWYARNRERLLAERLARHLANPGLNKLRKRVYKERYPERVALSDKKMSLKKYGLTLEEYDAIYDKQFGCCAVCCRPEGSSTKKRLHVDHDHRTGKVRGLLCGQCNVALGMVDDDTGRLESMIDYLKGHRRI